MNCEPDHFYFIATIMFYIFATIVNIGIMRTAKHYRDNAREYYANVDLQIENFKRLCDEQATPIVDPSTTQD